MGIGKLTRLLAAAVTVGAVLLDASTPTASAEPCSDVEVVFARGTSEPPGLGVVGQAFVDSLRMQVGTRSVSAYAVNYPASSNFDNSTVFTNNVAAGVRDASDHVRSTTANCPNTKVVLGGYSQGAVVAGFVAEGTGPAGLPASPLPPEATVHVAALTLFGKPSGGSLVKYGTAPLTGGPLAGKTTDLCASGDTICHGEPGVALGFSHGMYVVNGMTGAAAAIAAGQIAAT